MNRLLHLRIDLHHLLVQLRVLAHEDLGIPRGGDEDGVDATGQRHGEAVGDLQADEEGLGDDDGRELAVGVVARVREDEVEVGEARYVVSWADSWKLGGC